MLRAVALLVVVAASTAASADDDPDLAVVSGRAAKDAPSDFRLRLVRKAADELRGRTETYADLTLKPGAPFRIAGLPPGRYELVAEGGGLSTWKRTFDLCGDVGEVEVRPALVPKRADATFVGRLTFGFDGDLSKCNASIDGVPAIVLRDGVVRCAALYAGPAWLTVDYCDSDARHYPDERQVTRRFPLTLVAGENHADVRVDPNEDVRLLLRSPRGGARIDARVTILDDARVGVLDETLDDTPGPGPHAEEIAFKPADDGSLRAYRWILTPPDALRFTCVGADLPLLSLANGKHSVRVEADGFETVERAFDVDGPTRVDVALKPLPGAFVLPVVVGRFWLVEERGADGSWTPVLTWDIRNRACSYEDPDPARLFLAPGRHALRVVKDDAPPSATIEFVAGADGGVRPLDFEFPAGRALRGSVVTPSGTELDGFMAYCFARVGDRWERRRTQDVAVQKGFVVAGLAPGRYRLALDEKGEHVFAEFDMGANDVERAFTYRAR